MARTLIPNSTQVPDVILDHWMAELSGAEFKVLLYVARRTYGFGKESDNISLNQMAGGIKRRDGSSLDHGTGLSRSGVKAACNSLIQRGLLVRVNNRSEQGRECEESTYRLNLFANPSGVGQNKAYLGQKKTQVGQIGEGGRPETGQGVGQELAPQETDQETDQETAACTPLGETLSADAAAVLLEELVSHGVGRVVAERFTREKPESCRRSLEYLPYAEVRTTKGAWLANAIRDDYGPPPGYEQEKARIAREEEAQARRLAKDALQKHGAAIGEEKTARLGATYRQLEETRGEAFVAFTEHVEKERARTARIAIHLTPERREELLASFDKPERRLELFEAWLQSGPELSSKQTGSTHADEPHPPGAQQPEWKGGLFVAQAS